MLRSGQKEKGLPSVFCVDFSSCSFSVFFTGCPFSWNFPAISFLSICLRDSVILVTTHYHLYAHDQVSESS